MTQAANLGALGTNVNSSGIAQAAGGGTAGTAGVTGFKNRIINGDMSIFQRGTAATSNLVFSVDRWRFDKGNDATESVSQSTDAPVGFSYSLRNTISVGDASIGASQFSGVQQSIEGFNIADLGWGTANAKTVTLSFWVRSSVTGQYVLNLRNSNDTRINPLNYTISSANTWEYKTVTVTGDTGGTWGSTNGIGIQIAFYAALGSSFIGGTANTWGAAPNYGCGTPVNGIASNGNIFAITGVQLEVGSAATNFDYLPFGTELMLCQRYFAKIGLTVGEALGMGMTQDSFSSGFFYVKYPVTMRSAATLAYNYIGVTDNANGTALATSIRSQASGTNASNFGLNWTNPGWTVFYNPMMVIAADATGFISMSAEL